MILDALKMAKCQLNEVNSLTKARQGIGKLFEPSVYEIKASSMGYVSLAVSSLQEIIKILSSL